MVLNHAERRPPRSGEDGYRSVHAEGPPSSLRLPWWRRRIAGSTNTAVLSCHAQVSPGTGCQLWLCASRSCFSTRRLSTLSREMLRIASRPFDLRSIQGRPGESCSICPARVQAIAKKTWATAWRSPRPSCDCAFRLTAYYIICR